MSSSMEYKFSTLKVTTLSEFVKHVELDRPSKRNAMNKAFWIEMRECFSKLSQDEDCRVIVLSGAGKIFTAGLDLEGFLQPTKKVDVVRQAAQLTRDLAEMQESFTCIEKCPKPVIAAMHGACIGAGLDMVSACDIRLCTKNAWFIIKEVDVGLAADLGTLQRFPKIVQSDSLTRELVYTARNFSSDEAKSIGLVSRIYPTKEEMMSAAQELAKLIASKSPVAVQGSKVNLIYSRDHSVADGLHFISTFNSFAVQSKDVKKASLANMKKEIPTFSKL